MTEPQGTAPSYFPNAIEIDCERNLFFHFTRLVDDFAFRTDDYGSSVPQLTGSVNVHEIALVHYGICLSNDQFLPSINGSSHGRMDNNLGPLPHQRARRFWNPPVIADGDPKAPNIGNIEYDELSSGFHSFFMWNKLLKWDELSDTLWQLRLLHRHADPLLFHCQDSLHQCGLGTSGATLWHGVYNQLIQGFITPSGGNWSTTTFNAAVDMASGNYDSSSYESDEGSTKMSAFLNSEAYSSKITDAFAFQLHSVTPDTSWIYHSSDMFLATSAMNLYLQQQKGSGADLFNLLRDDVYIPLNTSQGFRTILRTDNSATGHPTGYYGLFYLQDDIAKIGNWLNNGGGRINNTQVLEPTRLTESLFRNPNVTGLSVRVPGDTNFFYKDGTWGKTMTPSQFPQYTCTFRVAYMSGFGGNTVLLLPNGVTYYIFTDNNQFYWYNAVNEINKIAKLCP